MRLRTKFLITFLLAFVFLSVVVLGGTELFKQQTITEERNDVQQTAQLAANQLDSEIRNEIDTARQFGARPKFADFDRTEPNLEQFLAESNFFAGGIVHPNGTIIDYRGIADQQRIERIGEDIGDERGFRLAMNGSSVVRPPERSDEGDWIVVQFAPITVSGETADGVLIGVGRFSGVQTGGVEGEWGRAVFGSLDSLLTDQRTVRVEGATYPDSGQSETIHRADREFDATIRGTATVESTGWNVTVVQNRAPLDSRLNALLLVQGVGLIVILGTIGGIGYWQYRTSIQQTEELLEGFEALGGGQFDHSVSFSAAEEWERIGDGFDDLSTALGEREQQLSVLNRVLRHNLQNDLSIVQTYGELIPTFESQEQREEASEKILGKTRKLLSHGEKARQIDKAMEAGKDGLTRLDVTDIVELSVESVQRNYPDATYRTDLPDEQGVWGIRGLNYGVETLVENAVEHNGSDDPIVDVSVTQPTDDEVHVTISDNGPGIPDHEYEVLSQQEETDLEHGSGVGLWLAHIVTTKSVGSLRYGDQEDGGEISIVLNAADLDDEANDDADDEQNASQE